MWLQKEIKVKARQRGFQIITNEIVKQLPEIGSISIGIVHLFIQHTSASLTINENADFDVQHDIEAHLNKMIPENAHYYRHTSEGAEDMPAPIKSSVIGCSITIPISNGKLNLGMWQGVYLCEQRNNCGVRKIIATINGV
jgi:secondary thiamine-phosphate synthase enzyme